MACGKAIKEMTGEDWDAEIERSRTEIETVDAMEARGATAEENEWMHALADRYDDFARAANIITGAEAHEPRPRRWRRQR
jgi:hypothetical protein